MSAQIIILSEARLRYRARRVAGDLVTSPVVIAAAICCLPFFLVYVTALEATEMFWRSRS